MCIRDSVNTTRRPKWFQPDSGGVVPSMAGTRWTRATGTSSTLFRSKYMARWHSMAIKIIRQANQTGGNGPEIEQVPPCGIEACHQMQIWNYYKSTLSLRQRMHTHKRFPTCVGGFICNLHQKRIRPKIMDRFFSNWVRRNSGDLQLDLTHANCIAQFYKSRVHAARHGRSQHRNQQWATSKQMVSK